MAPVTEPPIRKGICRFIIDLTILSTGCILYTQQFASNWYGGLSCDHIGRKLNLSPEEREMETSLH